MRTPLAFAAAVAALAFPLALAAPPGSARAEDPPPGLIHVLYVEGYPRWEYRYLKSLLVRDPSYELRAYLVSAHRDFPQEASPGATPLAAPPTRADVAAADVVVLGDLAAADLAPETVAAIREGVERGRLGLVVIAGARGLEALAGSPLAPILPVALDGAAGRTVASTPLETTDAFVERLAPPADLPALPSIYWLVAGAAPREGATVLARTARAPPGAGGDATIVSGPAGKGRVAFIGTDEVWRWRAGVGDRHYGWLWRALIRDVAPAR